MILRDLQYGIVRIFVIGKYTLVNITRGYYPAPVNMFMPPSPRINNRKSAEIFPQTILIGNLKEGNLTDPGRCFYVLVNDWQHQQVFGKICSYSALLKRV